MLTLDDLFKKSASKPCIYWLPLTGAEAAATLLMGGSGGGGVAAWPGRRPGAGCGREYYAWLCMRVCCTVIPRSGRGSLLCRRHSFARLCARHSSVCGATLLQLAAL